MMFMDTIEPLADILESTGMGEKEVWERTGFYPKSIFDIIWSVRVTTQKEMKGIALLWGSYQKNLLVEEFAMHHFTEHPKIAYLLAITSMQKEGQLLVKFTEDLKREVGMQVSQDKRIVKLEGRSKKKEDK